MKRTGSGISEDALRPILAPHPEASWRPHSLAELRNMDYSVG
jgi:hypothetical protein